MKRKNNNNKKPPSIHGPHHETLMMLSITNPTPGVFLRGQSESQRKETGKGER
jgi:hypothetical protein